MPSCVHQPLYLRCRKEPSSPETTTPPSSDGDGRSDSWLSPIFHQSAPLLCSDIVVARENDDGHADSSAAGLWLPPAHGQHLSSRDDLPSYYAHLAGGCDHHNPRRQFDDHVSFSDDGYGSDEDDDDDDDSLPMIQPRRQESWLLGFASLDLHNNETNYSTTNGGWDLLPGLVSVPSSDSEGESSDDDDDSIVTLSSFPSIIERRRGVVSVSFSPDVKVQSIPNSSDLSSRQRRRMYSSSAEVRQNKIRNKKEFRYDGYDWRNATEECHMGVDVVTGELIHPVHEYELTLTR